MRAELRALTRWVVLRRILANVWRDFGDYDLLTYSSAIAFQILYAVVPLVLVGLGGLGILGFRSVYEQHIAPTLQRDLSHDGYAIANHTALHVLGPERVWWVTAGLVVTIWGVGAGLRSTMKPLNGIYGAREHRGYKRRLVTSLLGGLLVIVCVYGAFVLELAGRLAHFAEPWQVLFDIARWLGTFLLLLVVIAAMIRFVPAKKRPFEWITIGSLISAICWLVGTIGFGAYISAISYSSFYGALATVILLLIYLHVAAIAFLLGVSIDAQLREQVEART